MAVPNADHNEELFAVSSTTVQDWLHQWQEQGLLEPFRPGQWIRSWRLHAPWAGVDFRPTAAAGLRQVTSSLQSRRWHQTKGSTVITPPT
ncbi:MAG: hypothetical protein ACK535_11680 [Cyanobacteriota bacterium]